jgi:C_GCAxxG_C_C family probable redox protein
VDDPSEVASGFFGKGFNCAQSVLVAFIDQVGLTQSQALKLSSPFGAGVSRQGEMCGAVTGALMVIGLVQGSDSPSGKEDTYRLGQDFLQRFKAMHGSLLCRQLLDCDISTPAGLERARTGDLFSSVCPILVRDATALVRSTLVNRT